MDSTSLTRLEEILPQELLSHHTQVSLPLVTPLHGRHCHSADYAFPTSARPLDFSQVKGTSYDPQMPDTRLTDLSFVQNIYNTEIASEPSTLPFFTQLSGNAPLTTLLSQTGVDVAIVKVNPGTPSTSTGLVESFSHTPTPGGDSHRKQVLILSPPSNTTHDPLRNISSSTASTHDTPADPHTTERCYTPSSDTIVDQSIAHIPGATQKRWRCCHPNCTEPSDKAWRSIHDARNHVRKHLGETKLYRCIKCKKFFACEKNARRHQVNQGKRYHCTLCNGMFTRIDYRNKHQKSCGGKAEERRDSDTSI